jgi:hypothetical protein
MSVEEPAKSSAEATEPSKGSAEAVEVRIISAEATQSAEANTNPDKVDLGLRGCLC